MLHVKGSALDELDVHRSPLSEFEMLSSVVLYTGRKRAKLEDEVIGCLRSLSLSKMSPQEKKRCLYNSVSDYGTHPRSRHEPTLLRHHNRNELEMTFEVISY